MEAHFAYCAHFKITLNFLLLDSSNSKQIERLERLP
jgi:hypothetical protein